MSETDLKSLLVNLRDRTGMWVNPPTSDGVVAFLMGFEHALWDAPLNGLHEWLVVQFNGGNNLHWSGLARALAERGLEEKQDASAAESRRIELLCDLLLEFVETRERHGLRYIYLAYETWLRQQSWYDPDLSQSIDATPRTEPPPRRRRSPAASKRRGGSKR